MRTSQRQWTDIYIQDGLYYQHDPELTPPIIGPFFDLLDLLGDDQVRARRRMACQPRALPVPNQNTLPSGMGWIDLRRIPWVIRTIEPNVARRNYVDELLASYQVRDWSYDYGEQVTPYWRNHAAQAATILRSQRCPFVLAEDDIAPYAWCSVASPPADADIVSLGGGRGGPKGAARTAYYTDKKWKRRYRYAYQDAGDRWMRIAGMWYTHAVLIISEYHRVRLAEQLDRTRLMIDTCTAWYQSKCRWYCAKTPYLFQNDGHHKLETTDYAPE